MKERTAWKTPCSTPPASRCPRSQPAAAKAVLEKAGYTLKGGYFYQDGKELTLTLIAPSAYTDYAEVGSLAAGELKSAGINATFDGISVNAWDADMSAGTFSVAEHWSNNGLTPYNLFDNWLDHGLVTASAAGGDYERLNDPTIDADLAKLSGAGTLSQQIADMTPIAKYVAANLPVIPITTASEWFEYDSQNYVGWPTQKDPYETGQPSGTNNGPGAGTDLDVILHLSPRS
jgi:peptide/nickel transport system substrate-binding protein